LTDIIGLGNQSVHGLITWDTAWRAVTWLPALLVGVRLGARSFKGTNPETFRKAVLAFLAILAVIIGMKAVLSF
jgi:uncharacterized protein